MILENFPENSSEADSRILSPKRVKKNFTLKGRTLA
jgi:hypothetical protein